MLHLQVYKYDRDIFGGRKGLTEVSGTGSQVLKYSRGYGKPRQVFPKTCGREFTEKFPSVYIGYGRVLR